MRSTSGATNSPRKRANNAEATREALPLREALERDLDHGIWLPLVVLGVLPGGVYPSTGELNDEPR